ncbi:MAG: MmcQ/YjbR family DNA-binding protein [Pseudomonadota bacterium]
MKLDAYDAFCGALPHATLSVQWGGAHVWKIGGKMFAAAMWPDGDESKPPAVTFKVSDIAFEMLKDEAGCRPAPYLASRGMTWIQRTDARSLNDAMLGDYIKESYRLVAAGLTKKLQRELGLL